MPSALRTGRRFLLLPLLTGCIYISDSEFEAFFDRDGDGLDHKLDCDDLNAQVGGPKQYWPDIDGDGFGDRDATVVDSCELPDGHVGNAEDCDDDEDGISPVAVEQCDGLDLDEDCNGAADDADANAEGKLDWYPDDDGDTFGDLSAPAVMACDAPAAHVRDATDCDDAVASVNPDATEVCDPEDVDEDCSGFADDEDPSVTALLDWYPDADTDGFGDPLGAVIAQCEAPAGHTADDTDCDDTRVDVNPNGVEVCDPDDIDEDCSGAADDADPSATGQLSYFPDLDGDGYGLSVYGSVEACEAPLDHVLDGTDCDDTRAQVNPTEIEVCDAVDLDEDCSGLAEDADPGLDTTTRSTWYTDDDGDGFGDAAEAGAGFKACDVGAGFASNADDCDDSDMFTNPDVIDRPNDGDKNCDGFDYVCGKTLVQVPGDYPTIQAAIDAVTNTGVPNLCDGDIIEVLPGTYLENLSILDRSPIIRGALGSGGTTIDGALGGRAVNIERSSVVLEGFTIRNGDAGAANGGGVRVYFGVDAVLRDLVVEDNVASSGGGIDVENADGFTLIDSVVQANTATNDGGGVRLYGVGTSVAGELRIENTDILDNSASDEDGGLRIALSTTTTATVLLDGVRIEGNSAVRAGGLGARTVPDLVVYDTEILENDATASYGGAFLTATSSWWEGASFERNTTGGTLSALHAENFTTGGIDLVDVVFLDNTVTVNGYAVLLRGNETYGATLRRVTVASNDGNDGGAIFGGGLVAEGKLDATNLLVYDNTGFYGMRILQENAVPNPSDPATHAITNATFVGNDGHGLDVEASVATSITLKNIISAHNGEYGVDNVNVPPTVSFSDVFGNGNGGYSGVAPVGNGNLTVDPLFVSFNAGALSSTWDLELAAGSPLIDAGDPTILDLDGTTSDMGHFGGPEAP